MIIKQMPNSFFPMGICAVLLYLYM